MYEDETYQPITAAPTPTNTHIISATLTFSPLDRYGALNTASAGTALASGGFYNVTESTKGGVSDILDTSMVVAISANGSSGGKKENVASFCGIPKTVANLSRLSSLPSERLNAKRAVMYRRTLEEGLKRGGERVTLASLQTSASASFRFPIFEDEHGEPLRDPVRTAEKLESEADSYCLMDPQVAVINFLYMVLAHRIALPFKGFCHKHAQGASASVHPWGITVRGSLMVLNQAADQQFYAGDRVYALPSLCNSWRADHGDEFIEGILPRKMKTPGHTKAVGLNDDCPLVLVNEAWMDNILDMEKAVVRAYSSGATGAASARSQRRDVHADDTIQGNLEFPAWAKEALKKLAYVGQAHEYSAAGNPVYLTMGIQYDFSV